MAEPIVSDKIIPIITDIGKQALFQKDIDGLKINITHVAIGSGRYAPNTEQTTLKNEKLREPFLSSNVDKENYQISLNSIFKDKEKEFWVTEVGFFLDDGTLFAVWSHPTTAMSYKSLVAEPIFAFTLKLVDVNIDAIEIIDQGVDLTLNYAKEFLSMGLSITRLSGVVLGMGEQLRDALDEFDARANIQLEKMAETQKAFDETKDEFSLEIFKKSVIDWQVFEALAEYIRHEKNTGIFNVNQNKESLGDAYNQPVDIRYSPLNKHNHPNYRAMPGSGWFVANANGYLFQTRHNDYRLKRPKADGGFMELEDNLPEPLVLTGTVAGQTEYVKGMYENFLDGTLADDEKKYFRYSISMLEAWFEIVDEIDGDITDAVDSFRHAFDAHSPIGLAQKAIEFRTLGKKARFENYPYLPMVAKIDQEGVEKYVVLNYRIVSVPVPQWDGKKWDEIMSEKEDIVAEARFGDIPFDSTRKKFSLNDVDSILGDIPGLGGYSESITKKTPDGHTIVSPENGARYHRNYTIATDATGRANYTNGWNDPTLILAYTDNEKVFGGVSYAIPLEITLSTPVQSWNPYEFVNGTVTGDGSEANPYTKTNPNGRWYQTPAELYAGFDQADPADTGTGAKWVLDPNEEKHLVVPSGVWILLPKLEGIEERIRCRYPIYYTAHEYSPENIALSAARKQMLGVGVANTKAITYLNKKLLEGAGHLSNAEIEEVLEALKNSDSDLGAELKEQREALLLPIVSNTLGITRITNILINNKEKK